jgi:uncharacterized membrane protein YgcG
MILVALLLVADVAAPPDAPPALEMTRPIVDRAGVLSEGVDDELSHAIHDHLEQSGVAIGVLIVPSLGSATIRDAANAAGNAFQAGFGKDHSSVVIVIAIRDRVMRINGDDRLKATLTDRDIEDLTTAATSSFRNGNIEAGVRSLVTGVIAKTPHAPRDRAANVQLTLLGGGAVIALAILASIVVRLRERRRARAGAQTGAQTG